MTKTNKTYRQATKSHFFNPKTRVSVDLPAGWIEGPSGDFSATYFYKEKTENVPTITITTTNANPEETISYNTKVDGFDAAESTNETNQYLSYTLCIFISKLKIRCECRCDASQKDIFFPVFQGLKTALRVILI